MRVPNKIQELANQGLERMFADPMHHFDWRVRRNMYRIFVEFDGSGRVQGWLGIIAARYVLPLFVNTYPDDDLPRRLLAQAELLVTGKLDRNADEVHQLSDEGYMGTGIDAIAWRDQIAYNAEYAGEAAYKAHLEASGHHHLLENLKDLRIGTYSSGESVFSMGGTDEDGLWQTADVLSDNDIAHLAAYSDTASAASVAYSCAIKHSRTNRLKRREFWQWWVDVALPQAWSHL